MNNTDSKLQALMDAGASFPDDFIEEVGRVLIERGTKLERIAKAVADCDPFIGDIPNLHCTFCKQRNHSIPDDEDRCPYVLARGIRGYE